MAAVMRCKMRVSCVKHVKDANGETTSEEVTLQAVYGPAGSPNAMWAKWTPQASFTATIDNPSAMGKLSSGHEFYVDFVPVDPATEPAVG